MSQSQVVCPNCQRRFDPATSEAMPFCCERCRLIDLGHWMSEEHGFPVESEDQPLDEEVNELDY